MLAGVQSTEDSRFVLTSASPHVRSAAMTALFDTKLQDVEAGRCELDVFVAELESFVREEVEKIRKGT